MEIRLPSNSSRFWTVQVDGALVREHRGCGVCVRTGALSFDGPWGGGRRPLLPRSLFLSLWPEYKVDGLVPETLYPDPYGGGE